VPQFADHPPALSAPQMFVAIKHGIRYSGMGGWNGMMSDEEIWKVATFLEHIGSLPPEVPNWSGCISAGGECWQGLNQGDDS
jgi:mono/diheme cytochrome c family protein